MNRFVAILLGILLALQVNAQVKIHAHNDYVKPQPFTAAYLARADQIEVDVFLQNDSLMVAHSKKEIKTGRTLNSLYLQPIVAAFVANKGRVSTDRAYRFSLMIDVKENWEAVYPVLKRDIEKVARYFNRAKNKRAVQVVISGVRPEHVTFHRYPNWLFFDGLPGVNYAPKDLKRVTMISDNYAKYSKWRGFGEMPAADKEQLKAVINQAHAIGRPVRFWGAPDQEASWRVLAGLGADIINTDNINASTLFFKNR